MESLWNDKLDLGLSALELTNHPHHQVNIVTVVDSRGNSISVYDALCEHRSGLTT